MSYGDLIHRTWRENVLFSVMMELTYRCNLDCFFCYNDLNLQGRQLDTSDYLKVLDGLAELQCMNLILTGGEPLAHPGFFEIGAYARELGFVVRVKSNGHALRRRIARRLKDEVDPFVVDISLHGACAGTHDRQTRVAGSFDRLMSNIPELLELGVRLKLNATLTRWNEDEIEAMFHIADGFGIPMAMNPTVVPRDDGDRTPLSIEPRREARLRLYRLLDQRHRTGTVEKDLSNAPAEPPDRNCGAGSSSLTIDPYGNVLPCVQWRRPVGNVRERLITHIWTAAPELSRVRELTREARRVVRSRHGENAGLMGFCPGQAEQETGDPLGDYRSGLEQMQALVQVRSETAGARIPVRLVQAGSAGSSAPASSSASANASTSAST